MPLVSKIEQYGLEERVLTLHAQGYTTREIADEISADGMVTVSHDTVARWLQAVREERSETSKALVQAYLSRSLTFDLELFAQIRDQLNGFRLDDRLKVGEKLPCIRELRRVLETRLRLAGVVDKDTLPEFKDMTDGELDELIADTRRTLEASEGAGS